MIEAVFTTQEHMIRLLLDNKLDYGIEGKWALISIYRNIEKPVIEDRGAASKLRLRGCKKFLSLCFGDYTDLDCDRHIAENKEPPNLITIDQASQIVRFLKRIQKDDEIRTLVVQCKAGISRSGAVGLYACRLYGLDENTFFRNKNIRPNYYVYSKLTDIYNPLSSNPSES